jgi:erythronate-4-phosphate dehydrogenase
MTDVLIVADENIPLLDEFFGALGEIRRVDGRRMSAADVAGAGMLLVRSVTRVDAQLLGSTRPRFVGSATIGTDHVDLPWLAEQGIAFASAPGCNARAVAEYVATVLALFSQETGQRLQGLQLGVVGFGNVGRLVAELGRALGMRILVTDPLLTPGQFPGWVVATDIDELLVQADVVTLHVPLTGNGPAPTRHLLDRRRLNGGRWQLLLNTARGPVIDNTALRDMLMARDDRRAVLDVWEREPAVPADLLAKVWLASPHVAGYTSEGKWRGTAQIYRAACEALGIATQTTLDAVLTARGDAAVEIEWAGSLPDLLSACCPVRNDTASLREAAAGADHVSPARFDAMRREYRERREFAHYRVQGVVAEGQAAETVTPQETAALLRKLGFSVKGQAGIA